MGEYRGMIIDENLEEGKTKVGRKPLPRESKRRMYSARLHRDIIKGLKMLRNMQGRPSSRIIEGLISKEMKRLGL